MQYGVGSTKYKNWFNEIVNTIKNAGASIVQNIRNVYFGSKIINSI